MCVQLQAQAEDQQLATCLWTASAAAVGLAAAADD
jgi:hypothetical protein